MRMVRSWKLCGLKLLFGVVVSLAAATTGSAQTSFPFKIWETPQPSSDFTFNDAAGRETSLDALRGKVILLNVWATWCPPCRQEMPSLDRLQRVLGGPLFEVVALSLDSRGLDDVKAFYEDYSIRDLGVFIDASESAMRALRIVGLPTTLLLDEQGRELGRKMGPAEWDSAEALAFLRERVADISIDTVTPD